MECPNDWPLFSGNKSEVEKIFRPLRQFQKSYEPIHGYLCTCICSFGVLTNLIHIVILTRPNMRTSAVNVIMTAVALCDIGTMASYLVYILHFVMNKHTLCTPHLYSWMWMFFLMWHISLSIALHTASLWLAVAMAFVRLMTLRHTRLHSKWQSAQNAWKICTIIFVAIFVLCVPTVLSHEIKITPYYFLYVCEDPYLRDLYNRTYSAYTITIPQVAKQNNCKLYKANLWLTGIVFKVVPCILLGYLSINLLLRLRRAERKRRRLLNPLLRPAGMAPSSTTRRTDHTTILLISIVLVFLITELPQGAIAIMNAIFTQDVTRHIYYNFGDILDLLSLINSSVNFILYSIMSSRYRQTFCLFILPRTIYVRLFESHLPPTITVAAHDFTENCTHTPSTTGYPRSTAVTPDLSRKTSRRKPSYGIANGLLIQTESASETPTPLTARSGKKNVEFKFEDIEPLSDNEVPDLTAEDPDRHSLIAAVSDEDLRMDRSCTTTNRKFGAGRKSKSGSFQSFKVPKFLRSLSVRHRRNFSMKIPTTKCSPAKSTSLNKVSEVFDHGNAGGSDLIQVNYRNSSCNVEEESV